jgi:hypothetical protein
MKKSICSLLGVLSLSVPSYALVEHEINTKHPLKCSFSLNNQNRIIVSQGAVMKVIAPKDKFLIQIEENSGQAFILPYYDQAGSVTISVITTSGAVQDLEVDFKEQSSQVVFLKEKKSQNEEGSPHKVQENKESLYAQQLSDFLLGNRVEGFVQGNLDGEEFLRTKGIEYSLKKKLESQKEAIVLLEAKNISKKPIKLIPKELSISMDNWIFVEKELLSAGDVTLVAFSRSKTNG